MHLRIADLKIAGHVQKLRDLPQLGLKICGSTVQLIRVLTLQGELVQAFGAGAADLDRGDVSQEGADPNNLGQCRAQFLDDLVR